MLAVFILPNLLPGLSGIFLNFDDVWLGSAYNRAVFVSFVCSAIGGLAVTLEQVLFARTA